MTFDADKLRALDAAATWRTPEDNTVLAYGAEHRRFAPADKELRHYLRSHVPAILAMAEERDRMREALERIAEQDKVRSWTATEDNPETHWEITDGIYAIIARRALGKEQS